MLLIVNVMKINKMSFKLNLLLIREEIVGKKIYLQTPLTDFRLLQNNY